MASCWTCRLRRKGCDAAKPACGICGTLLIPCYGYGVKPGWMDGGEREKEMLAEIRSGVKLTTDGLRRSRALNALRQRHPLTSTDASPPNKAPADLSMAAALTEGATWTGRARPTQNTAERGIGFLGQNTSTIDPSEKLLHEYFNDVFPSQFPFYHASVPEKGYDWLRALVTRCQPLYHAVLALAVVHRGPFANNLNDNTSGRRAHERELEKLYYMAIAGLRQHIDRSSRKDLRDGLGDGIEVFACIVYLIMLENSRGLLDNWQKHMAASPGVWPYLKTYCSIFPPLDTSILHGDEKHIEAAVSDASSLDSTLSLVDHAAMEFFSAVFLWFDTLATASTSRRPQFADLCVEAFGSPDSTVRLRNIMGCENRVMIIIRDIAVLDGSRTNRQEIGLTSDSVSWNYGRLRERLSWCLAEPWESYLSLITERTKQAETSDWLVQATPIVTYIFACAAMVYLTVVVRGPDPTLSDTRAAVTTALNVLNALPDVQVLRSLLWPFCIIGCMACQDQEASFTDLALRAGITINDRNTAWRSFQVIETCWQIRREGHQGALSADWYAAMARLGYQVLLV